jgi:hypothetical protein
MPDKLWPEATEVLPIHFTFEKGNLCVSLSRAKYHLALFGDFRCLMQCYASQHKGTIAHRPANKLLRDLWDEGAIISVGDWSSNAPPKNGSFGDLIQTLEDIDLRDPEVGTDVRYNLPYGHLRASGANRGGGHGGDVGRGGGAWRRGNEGWRRGSWRDRGGNTAE